MQPKVEMRPVFKMSVLVHVCHNLIRVTARTPNPKVSFGQHSRTTILIARWNKLNKAS